MGNSLAVTKETTFGNDGIATIVVGPAIRGEVWDIEQISVSTDNTDDFLTQAYVYRETLSPSNLIEATINGNADVTNTNMRITAPELVWIQWLLGESGKRAVLRIEGKREY